MLIFLRSARGLHKNAHFFPNFLNIEYKIFQIFSYIFQQENVTINVFSISPTQRLRFSINYPYYWYQKLIIACYWVIITHTRS